MLRLRILTVIVVLPLFVAAMLLLPNSWWSIALIVPLLVAGHEWARLTGIGHGAEIVFLAALMSGCLLLWAIASHGETRLGGTLVVVDRFLYAFSTIFWCVIAPYWLRLKLIVRNPYAVCVVGLIVLLPTWLALARLQNEPLLLLALLAVVWVADTAAYFTGRALGTHKLAPVISPGKTWEGVGGAFAAVTVYALVLHFSFFPTYDLSILIPSFLAMTCFGIVGDLFESLLKRNAHVKDSGNIFPGHGGMLDRIDAVIAALPVAALIFI